MWEVEQGTQSHTVIYRQGKGIDKSTNSAHALGSSPGSHQEHFWYLVPQRKWLLKISHKGNFSLWEGRLLCVCTSVHISGYVCNYLCVLSYRWWTQMRVSSHSCGYLLGRLDLLKLPSLGRATCSWVLLLTTSFLLSSTPMLAIMFLCSLFPAALPPLCWHITGAV